jgi:hypothetical protein
VAVACAQPPVVVGVVLQLLLHIKSWRLQGFGGVVWVSVAQSCQHEPLAPLWDAPLCASMPIAVAVSVTVHVLFGLGGQQT